MNLIRNPIHQFNPILIVKKYQLNSDFLILLPNSAFITKINRFFFHASTWSKIQTIWQF